MAGCGRCPGGGNPPVINSCGSNCFRINDVTISCTDGPAPCGDTFSKDLSLSNTEIQGCSNTEGDCTVTYQLLSSTSDLINVALSSAGLLTGETTNAAVSNTIARVRYRVYCNCNGYSGSAKVNVCIKNLCTNTLCDASNHCDKCTGLCTPNVPNAILN